MKMRTGIAWFICLFNVVASVDSLNAGGVVSSCDETGLRAAMVGGGAVTFACDGTITLTAPLFISTNTSFDATGYHVILSGGHTGLVFQVGTASLNLTNLTIADGAGTAAGGILNSGALTTVNCTFAGNTNTLGFGSAAAAIYNTGTLLSIGCTFVSNNVAANVAAAAINIPPANPNPGTASMTLINCTFFRNYRGPDVSTAISQFGNGASTIVNCTIAGGVSYTTGPPGGDVPITLKNSIVFGAANIIDAGNNICSGASASFTNQFSVVNTDPRLDELADNGGPTLTMALLPDSPAINYANPNFAPLMDQRGFARPYSIAPDVGAFETVFIGTNSGVLGFTATNLNTLANSVTASVAVYRDHGATGAASVTFATANGTATAGQDYVATNGTLSFASGEILKSFNVAIIANPQLITSNTILLALSNPTGGASLGTAAATLTIQPAVRTLMTNDETSLRAEIAKGGMILLGFNGTVTLTGPLLITNDVSLAGSGHSVTVSGANSNRLFNVRPGNTLLLADLTLADGRAPATNGVSGNPGNPGGPGYGGAIYAENAVVRALNCYFRSNAAVGGTGGDGIASGQTGTGGAGAGGAIYVYQTLLSATNCVFSRNQSLGGTGGGGSQAFSTGGDAAGGAIYNFSGTNHFFNCQFADNSAKGGLGRRFNATGGSRGGSASGGAFYNSTGEVWISRSTFSGNSDMSGKAVNSSGGAICQNGGNLGLFESLLASNTVSGGDPLLSGSGQPLAAAHAFGGGVFVGSGALWFSNSTFVGNSAIGGAVISPAFAAGIGFGGGVYNLGTVQAGNSTLVGNTASGGAINIGSQQVPGPSSAFGGAIYNDAGLLAVDYVTLAGNQARIGPHGNATNSLAQGGALFSTNSTPTLHCTILANSPSGSNCFGVLQDNGHNLSSDSSCHFSGPGSLNDTDPKLGSLDDYGGPTPTMALLQGSPAIDGGDNSLCPLTDQRGRTRPFGTACDIGPFESAPPFVVRGHVYGFTLKDDVAVSNGATTMQTAGGSYSFCGLTPGEYTITPSHPNYLFVPPNGSVTVGPDRIDFNFKAYRWNALSLEGISNNALVMKFAGTNSVPYRLEASSNFFNWVTVVESATTESNLLGFVQPVGPGMRFYRVVTP